MRRLQQEETIEETVEEMTEVEKKYQQEEEKYVLQEKICIGQLSEEEESITRSEYSGNSYFG